MSDKTTFQLEFVTPERVIASKRAEMVVIPGAEGDIGVLPGHAPVITQLRPGMVCTFSGQAVIERVFIEGGIAQIDAENCVILIEKAEDEKSLDSEQIAETLAAKRDKESDAAEMVQLNMLEAKLEALRNPPYA